MRYEISFELDTPVEIEDEDTMEEMLYSAIAEHLGEEGLRVEVRSYKRK